jgi:hypothetical protein
MAKYTDPASAFDEGRFLSGDKDLPKPRKPKVKKPHPSCTTPEACVAQGRCRKTGKKLVNGKVAK